MADYRARATRPTPSRMTRTRSRLGLSALALVLTWGCTTTPTSSFPLVGPTPVIYMIDFGDPAKAASFQGAFPRGVTGLSPQGAAQTFNTPVGGLTPGRGFVAPGIYVLPAGLTVDPSVASGTTPYSFVWVGYFIR